MGVIVTGILAAVVIAIGAGFFLQGQEWKPAWEVYSSTESTRVGNPGYNLVGRNWRGEPTGLEADAGTTGSNG
ncbi:hypothetical protein ACUN0C_07075 [Faunimonas sp. B44]|uniref:hypothetical protein n=1 Tax=Faunimonas sp. B44 TaxID=3461493 RepID=UPI0040445F0E